MKWAVKAARYYEPIQEYATCAVAEPLSHVSSHDVEVDESFAAQARTAGSAACRAGPVAGRESG